MKSIAPVLVLALVLSFTWSDVGLCQNYLAGEPSVNTKKFAQTLQPMEFHIHLRNGMTVEKAIERQEKLGIRTAVLENSGRGWPFDTNEKLQAHIDTVKKAGLKVGMQVNDRDWFTFFDKKVLDQLDYVLADTFIMPDMDKDGNLTEPKKMWLPGNVTLDTSDEAAVEKWMERYMAHNIQVVNEPITVLANPTWLPPCLKDRRDLWTPERVDTLIKAAVKNNVALEINVGPIPSVEFIKRAKELGAKFTIGVNNFDDKLESYDHVWERVEECGLTEDDFFRL